MSEWLGPLPASNFTVGREGNPITLIVDGGAPSPYRMRRNVAEFWCRS